MAHIVFLDPRFYIDGADLADHVTEESLTLSTDAVSDVAGGDTIETFMAGIRKAGCKISGYHDHAVGEIDATIFPLWSGRTAAAFRIGADKTSAISTSNPEYQFSAIVMDYNPLAGRIGEAHKFELTLALTTDVTRDVTP